MTNAAPGTEADMSAPEMSDGFYGGSCQCGAVAFRARPALEGVFQCNCSRCRRLNAVMASVKGGDFELLRGEEALGTYRFNSNTIAHRFCTRCGIQPFAQGADRDGNAMYVVNVHCLDGARYDKTAITHFNGADF